MDKLEKHIKSKLNERQIRPSDAAWHKVEAELGAAPKSNKRGYYYAIAASFIGALVVSSVYFFRGSAEDRQPKIEVVVSEPQLKEEARESDNMIKEDVGRPTISQSTTTLADTKTIVDKVSPMVDSRDKVIEENLLTDNAPEKKVMDQVALNDSDKIIEAKLSEVLAQVSDLEAQNVLVTDAEVDSLLRVAQREILTEQLFQDNGKVDAMALLNEVEEELDQSFRDQIFEKLKDGFFRVRTAVADRNN